MSLCLYYQAHVVPSECWFFVGILRSFEHVCFDRTINVQESVFEFFVPSEQNNEFLLLMNYFQQEGIIHRLQQLTNRLEDPNSKV